MIKKYDPIAETLDVDAPVINLPKKVVSKVPATSDDFAIELLKNKKKDYTVARDNVIYLIEMLNDVVKDSVIAVRSDPTPRMLESFCQLVNSYTAVNNQLLKLGELDTTKQNNISDSPINNNIIFSGTTESLIEQIKRTFDNK